MASPQTINLSGRGDMGSLTNRMVVPRLFLPVDIYALQALRVTFAGGSGSALLQLKVDHRFGSSFDRTIYELAGAGSAGKNVEFRVEESERDTYLFYWDEERFIRDELVILWTDPDGSKLTTWGISAELLRVS